MSSIGVFLKGCSLREPLLSLAKLQERRKRVGQPVLPFVQP